MKNRKYSDNLPYILLIITVLLGLYMKVSIDYHDNSRNMFCLANGFEGYDHELTLQLYYCYKGSQKTYMASYTGNYALFSPETSCLTPQFKTSKICLFRPQ